MIKSLFLLLIKTFSELGRVYLFILVYPFSLFKNLFLKNNAYFNIKLYITRWGLLPMFNVIYSLVYTFIVKPMKRYFLVVLAPHLYNHSQFYRELEKADAELLDNHKNMYKYLLFNRDNESLKLPDPEINRDDLLTYLAYFRRIIEPGWRQHYIHFYHTDFYLYRPKMYQDAMRLYRRKAAESKHIDSISICITNIMLLYRYLFNQYIDFAYEYYCYINYLLRQSPFLCNFMSFLKYSYVRNLVFTIFKVNFTWFSMVGNYLFRWYNEVLSLGEIGTERSIYYSKKFGFGGNLHLQFGYFLKEWDMYLEKNMDYSNHRIIVLDEYYLKNVIEEKHRIFTRAIYLTQKSKKLHHLSKTYRPYKLLLPDALDNDKGRTKLNNKYARRKLKMQSHMYPYRKKLDEDKSKLLIRKDLLSSFNKHYVFYKNVYSIFGKLTTYLHKMRTFVRVNSLNKYNRISEKSSFLNYYSQDADNITLSIVFIVTLESILFIIHVLNN